MGNPMDRAALLRLQAQHNSPSHEERLHAAAALSARLLNGLPTILAALDELERFRQLHEVAEDAVLALTDLGACPDPLCAEPNCLHVLPRLVAALAALPARETRESDRG
jgi:hypothetical protein